MGCGQNFLITESLRRHKQHSGEWIVNIDYVFFQGILQGIYFGLGGGLGAIIGGVLVDGYGVVPSFRLGALMSIAVLIAGGLIQLCILRQKKNMKKEAKQLVELTTK